MRLFIAVLVLIFSLQSLTKADDIRDFQIEGMGIGDSALDFFTEEKIKINIRPNVFERFSDKKFVLSEIQYDSMFQTYDTVQIIFKRNDKKYQIYGMTGAFFYKKNIDECYDKMKGISSDILKSIDYEKKNEFNNLKMSNNVGVYSGITFYLKKGIISVHCYDWSEKTEKEKNWLDNLRVNIKTDELEDFLNQ
tara:strand:+ start:748 stop:1326 length:579 start_codon:yes stop_codon:yes gene_type:complete